MKYIVVFMLCLSLLTLGMSVGSKKAFADAKKAILVVSFGTSYADTRAVTIEAIEQKVAETFPDYEMRRAFTSHIIMKILKERDGIEVDDVEQALTKLQKEGFSEVIVQSTHIIPGAEFHDLLKVAHSFAGAFDKLEIGMPLLSSTDDLQKAAEALKTQMPELQEAESVVFMGHGTHHAANATYAAIERIFEDMDMERVLVGTVEGFPTLESTIKKLRKLAMKKVTLMPMMFVAGDHAQNDMAGDEEDSWKTILTNEGFEVETSLLGMGENAAIQALYIQHIKDAMEGGSHGGHHE